MKNSILLFIIVVLFTWIGCTHPSVKSLIDGGNYKYWYYQDKYGPYFIFYFDTNGNRFVFVKSTNGLRRYDDYDNMQGEKWTLTNNSIINVEGIEWCIKELTNRRMIIKFSEHFDTLYSAPNSMIPKEYRKRWSKKEYYKLRNNREE